MPLKVNNSIPNNQSPQSVGQSQYNRAGRLPNERVEVASEKTQEPVQNEVQRDEVRLQNRPTAQFDTSTLKKVTGTDDARRILDELKSMFRADSAKSAQANISPEGFLAAS